MCRSFFLEVLVGALGPTMSFNNTCLRELESQLPSRNLEHGASVAELASNESCLRFVEDAVSIMLEQKQNQGPQPREVEAGRIVAEAARVVVIPLSGTVLRRSWLYWVKLNR